MILLLWLLLLLSCMITYINYCFIIIVITMLIMIVYYYVYKQLQTFLTRLTGLRKGLVTGMLIFMRYICVRVCMHVCMFIVLFALFLYVQHLVLLIALEFVLWCPVFSRIFAYIYSSSSSSSSSSSIYYPGEFSPLAGVGQSFHCSPPPTLPIPCILLHYSPLFHVFPYHVNPSFHWPASLSSSFYFQFQCFLYLHLLISSYNMSKPPQSFLPQVLL